MGFKTVDNIRPTQSAATWKTFDDLSQTWKTFNNINTNLNNDPMTWYDIPHTSARPNVGQKTAKTVRLGRGMLDVPAPPQSRCSCNTNGRQDDDTFPYLTSF